MYAIHTYILHHGKGNKISPAFKSVLGQHLHIKKGMSEPPKYFSHATLSITIYWPSLRS